MKGKSGFIGFAINEKWGGEEVGKDKIEFMVILSIKSIQRGAYVSV